MGERTPAAERGGVPQGHRVPPDPGKPASAPAKCCCVQEAAAAQCPHKVSIGINTDLKGYVHTHFPLMSRRHPLIPKRFVMPWRQDMVHRKMILEHAELANIYTGPHEESLYLNNKERLCHMEDPKRIEEKWRQQPPLETIDFPMDSPLSRYKSSVLNHWTREKLVEPE